MRFSQIRKTKLLLLLVFNFLVSISCLAKYWTAVTLSVIYLFIIGTGWLSLTVPACLSEASVLQYMLSNIHQYERAFLVLFSQNTKKKILRILQKLLPHSLSSSILLQCAQCCLQNQKWAFRAVFTVTAISIYEKCLFPQNRLQHQKSSTSQSPFSHK